MRNKEKNRGENLKFSHSMWMIISWSGSTTHLWQFRKVEVLHVGDNFMEYEIPNFMYYLPQYLNFILFLLKYKIVIDRRPHEFVLTVVRGTHRDLKTVCAGQSDSNLWVTD
jgi:hypothetical protein